MQPERFKQCRALFERAMELDPAAREKFLLDECAGDSSLRRDVEALIESDLRANEREFLRQSRLGEVVGEMVDQVTDLTGLKIDPFRIVRPIATGGMGTVYEAEQESPRRRVALKVLRTMFAGATVLRRFHVEAEILARLQHAGIAQVFASGTHRIEGEGFRVDLPWYALELLEGALPITAFASQRGLDTTARIRLFVRVCDAVHHAHSRGVIHRDLKPANILVAANGDPKVIDFGIARVPAGESDGTAMATATGEIVGTLRYMAPEQFLGDPDAIDTRTDVYALGVVLFELLCDASPFDLDGKSVTEVSRIVREEDPRSLRSTRRHLSEELQWIVSHALEKKPELRYASAAELKDDLERHLKHEVLIAGPPSASYRLRKFVARHRFALGAAFAIVVSLILGLIASLISLERARIAEAQASKDAKTARTAERKATEESTVSQHVIGLFERAFSEAIVGNKGRDLRVVDVLDESSRYADEQLKTEPRVAAAFHGKLAELYYSLAELEAADDHFTREIELLRTLPMNEVAQDLVTTDLDLVQIKNLRSKPDDALAVLSDASDTAAKFLPANDPSVAGIHHRRGAVYLRLNRLHDAEAEFRIAVDLRKAQFGAEEQDTLDSMNSLSVTLMEENDLETAEPYARGVVEGLAKIRGQNHPFTLMATKNLASLLRDRGKYQEAYDLVAPTVPIREQASGTDHPDTLDTKVMIAQLLGYLGRRSEAVDLLRSLREAFVRKAGRGSPNTLDAVAILVGILNTEGRYSEAEAAAREGLQGLTGTQPHTTTAGIGEIRCGLGYAIGMHGNYEDGLDEIDAGLDQLKKTRGESHGSTLRGVKLRAALESKRDAARGVGEQKSGGN